MLGERRLSTSCRLETGRKHPGHRRDAEHSIPTKYLVFATKTGQVKKTRFSRSTTSLAERHISFGESPLKPERGR